MREFKEFPITKSTGRVLHMAQKPTAKKTVAEDPRYTQALQSYEAGLRAMQEHKFDKAKPHFQKVIAGPSKELADRAHVHLNICNQHLDRAAATQFKTPEEHFDYAVSLMNVGDYVTAREHLEKLLKQNAKSDYVVYGLAALDCLTGHVEDSLRTSGRSSASECAIALPGAQRFRFPEPGGGSALHGIALSRSRGGTRLRGRRPRRRRARVAGLRGHPRWKPRPSEFLVAWRRPRASAVCAWSPSAAAPDFPLCSRD